MKKKKLMKKKIKEINNDKLKKDLKVKEEQLLLMKMNNEKITSLYEQKSKFLENEVTSWKNRYHDALVESKNKEDELNKENNKLKEQNKMLEKLQKKLEENKSNKINFSNSFNNKTLKNNIYNTINKENKKDKVEEQKIIPKNYFNERNNRGSSLSNTGDKENINEKENKNINLQEQLINIEQYKEKINSSKDFQCKFCLKSFSFPEYKEHFNICEKNPMNNNSNNININKNKIISISTVNTSDKRSSNNSEILRNTTSSSKSSVNRKNIPHNIVLNSFNANNKENNNQKYINIKYDSINNIINIIF